MYRGPRIFPAMFLPDTGTFDPAGRVDLQDVTLLQSKLRWSAQR